MTARLLLALCALAWGGAGADPHALILSGSGGEPPYERRFAQWGDELRAALVALDFPADRVQQLSAPGDSLAHIEAAFARVPAADPLFVFLIGHGSYRNGVAKLNIPGPDLSAARLDTLLGRRRPAVVVNAASQSAAFINALSRPGRVVCTSTKSVDERNAPWFMAHFIEALARGGADRDRDDRISVWEACGQAAALTLARYAAAGQLATEHALIDDDGDGLGSRLSPWAPDSPDGALARKTYLRDARLAAAPELLAAYARAIEKVEALKRAKGTTEEGEYYRRLEQLLLEAARYNRQIRAGGR